MNSNSIEFSKQLRPHMQLVDTFFSEQSHNKLDFNVFYLWENELNSI